MERIGTEDDGCRSMFDGVRNFADEVSVIGIFDSLEDAIRIALLRFVTEHYDRFAGDVYFGVVVVVVFRCRDPISDEHQRQIDRP